MCRTTVRGALRAPLNPFGCSGDLKGCNPSTQCPESGMTVVLAFNERYMTEHK
jgi:hypothetical protein